MSSRPSAEIALLARLPKPQMDRLAYIDFRLLFLGELGRADLVERFKTGPAGATRDIAMYRQVAPDNLDFDAAAKVYRPSPSFKPLLRHEPHRVLTAVSQGFGEVATDGSDALVRCEFPSQLSSPRIEVIAAVTRAIHRRKALRVSYVSLTSGASEREIVPLGLVNTGVRWHVRAFDRKTSEFRDFVLTRLTKASLLETSEAAVGEGAEHDLQWSRVIQLELVPHPGHERADVIKLDYDMTEGVLRVNVRAANVGYMLRLWSIDCSPNHRLSGPEYTLWLKDPLVLYGADSAHLGPGYEPPVTTQHKRGK
ncbi:MAG: WYL domain-containing protein [Burkholderiales bacterium]|nr:MAG: WYL domain-containing protein [Burkholderiales bacterium]